ncbi:MobC family plasmid mobilization relaxosome protein [Cellulomonas sp. NPDC055163]
MAEEALPARRFGRRRQANVAGGRPKAYKVTVSDEENDRLVALAGEAGTTVPRLLVESALADRSAGSVSERRNAAAELFRVYRLLAAVSNNVNQIARATNATGEVHEELVATLAAVRRTAERVDGVIEGLRVS